MPATVTMNEKTKPVSVKETTLDHLVPDDRNFNKGTEFGNAMIEKSLRKLGAGRSIVLDKNNRIIAGNKTVENAASVGLDKVIVVETTGDQIVAVKRVDIDLDSKKGRELALADNATSKANLDWDEGVISAVAAEWDINTNDWGVDLPEAQVSAEDAEEDSYEIPDNIETDIKPGDAFELHIGPIKHRLVCGDATSVEDVERLMNGAHGDLVLTDPPYNVDYEGKTKDKLKIENDKMTADKFYEFLLGFFSAVNHFIKPGGSWYIWHADSEGANFRRAMAEAGIPVRQCLVWVKNTFVMGRQDYHWQHEPCLYGWKEGASHSWYNDRKQSTVLNFDRPMRNADHPTMKPVKLFAYQIGNSSKAGDIVVDPFAGSGTAMIASTQMNRNCYAMELDPKYCQVIIDRMLKEYPECEVIELTK